MTHKSTLALLAAMAAATASSAQLTGPSSSATPYFTPTAPGWSVTSILTVGDQVGGYTMAGIPDGLGAWDNGDNTFTLVMNHELGSSAGLVRDHGAIGSFVSKWVISKTDYTVISGGDLMKNVYDWNTTTQASNATTSTIAFNRFCSANLATQSAFYNSNTGLGSQARIFMGGEESNGSGKAMAHIADGANAGNSYVLGKFNLSTNNSGQTGLGAWETLAASPFQQDKTVVIGNNDGGTGIMANSVAVYVGTKTNTGTEADKAGLTNGTLKFVNVAGSTAEIVDSTTRATDITSGTAFTLSDTASTTFSRPEDGAWDTVNSDRYYFVTTDRLDTVGDGIGSQIGRSRLWALNFTDITNPDLGGTIDMLLDGTEGGNMFDNITVLADGNLILQEDVGNAAHNGKIWEYNPNSDSLVQIFQHDVNRFGDLVTGATAPFTQDEESSGVIDISDIIGGSAKTLLFVSQAHYLTGDPATVEGGQLVVASFNTSAVPEPSSAAALAGLAGLGLAASRRRQRRA